MTSARHFDRRSSHSAPTSSTAQGEPPLGLSSNANAVVATTALDATGRCCG
jgi:hypothetical protein